MSVFYLSVKADSDFKVVVDALHSVLRPDATPKKSITTYIDASTPKKEFYKANILAVILDHNPILFVVK